MGRLALSPSRMPAYTTSSGTWSAPASSITTRSRVEATVRAIFDFFRCSSVGLITNPPSTKPTETPETGPFHGTSERLSAAEAPTRAATSGRQSGSALITVQTTETPLRRSFGNSGRMERSIMRPAATAFSVGRPSRLK